jgi:hypothetical protein
MSISQADITPEQWQRLKTGEEQLRVFTSHAETPYVSVWDLAGFGLEQRRRERIAALDRGEQVQCSTTGGETILLQVREDVRWTPDAWKRPSFKAERNWNRFNEHRMAIFAERHGSPT